MQANLQKRLRWSRNVSRWAAAACRLSATSLAVLALGACTTWTPVYKDVTPVVGPIPYLNRTPMHGALVCLQGSTRASQDVRLGVADFVDGSGATMGDTDVSGRYFSQRPDLMLIVALSKTGVRLVNRTSTAVAEWEMRQAMDRRLGDGKPVVVGQTRFDYRPVRAGELLGSTYYVNGAITEINWALSSNVEEAGFLGVTAGRRTYRVSIAIDLVVTNSLTTEVSFARSYSKQLVGYETGTGVFRFVDASIMPKARVELFQANIGQKQNEPVQQALRWLVELAGYEVVAALTGGDARCDALVPGRNADETEIDDEAPEPISGLRAQGRPSTRTPASDTSPAPVPPRRLHEATVDPRLPLTDVRTASGGQPGQDLSASRVELARRDQGATTPPAVSTAGGRATGTPSEHLARPREEAEPDPAAARATRVAQQYPVAPVERSWPAGRPDAADSATPLDATPIRPRQEVPWFRPASTRASGQTFRRVFGDVDGRAPTIVARRTTDE